MKRFMSTLYVYTVALAVVAAWLMLLGHIKQREVNESIEATVSRAKKEDAQRRKKELLAMVGYDRIKDAP